MRRSDGSALRLVVQWEEVLARGVLAGASALVPLRGAGELLPGHSGQELPGREWCEEGDSNMAKQTSCQQLPRCSVLVPVQLLLPFPHALPGEGLDYTSNPFRIRLT